MIKAIKSLYTVSDNELHPLNGIRALAIIFILLFHYNTAMVFKGLVKNINPIVTAVIGNLESGVDLFFILSGFLISSELYKSWTNKKKNFFKIFFLKRFFRIVPAYYFYLFIMILFLLFHLAALKSAPLTQFTISKIKMIESLLKVTEVDFCFLGNFIQGNNRHLWSLATEQQFYLLFPFLSYFFLFKQKLNVRLLVLGISYLAIMVTRFMLMANFNTGEFDISKELYWIGKTTRFDAILIGIVLMDLFHNHRDLFTSLKGLRMALIVMTGIIIVIASFLNQLILTARFANIAKYNLFNIGFGLLFFATLAGNKILTRFLSLIVFVPIARVSYTMYLWHMLTPSLSIAFVGLSNKPINTAVYLFIFIFYLSVTFIFSSMLYLIIEYPLCRLKNRVVLRYSAHSTIISGGLTNQEHYTRKQ